MINDLVDLIKEVSLRHKLCRTFKYQQKAYNNAQNNYPSFQIYLEDYSYHRLNITNNIFVSEFSMWILKQPDKSEDSIKETQDLAFNIAVDIIAYLDNHYDFLSVYDYDIITVSHTTDDDSAGVKVSLSLQLPSPLNLCDYEDNFSDEPYTPEPDKEIDVDIKDVGDIKINKIKIPKSNDC